MLAVKPGSHMYQLLRLLSISGEFPTASLGILGNVRTVKAMVHKMEAKQKIRLTNKTILNNKLFQVSGKGNQRTVRLVKKSLGVLNEIHPDAHEYYMSSFPEHKFTGDRYRIWRNHRIAEVIAMCMMAGIEFEPYVLHELQKQTISRVILETPSIYVPRNFKKIYKVELNKTIFTRVTGLLFYPGGSYVVYNTRNAVMKWSGEGELKTRQELTEIVRMNAEQESVKTAIVFGTDIDVALKTIIESDKSRRGQVRFDKIYFSIHYIPLSQEGISLLRILTLPDWHEKLMSSLFTADQRPSGYGSIEFDAYFDNKYIYSHLDGDIARLIRLKETLEDQKYSFDVICFPWQEQFLKSYLGEAVTLKPVETSVILSDLGILELGGDDEDEGE